MRKIPEEVVDRLLTNNDIVDVISEYVQLSKKGRNFFGLCPFHGENTPSFSVSQEKQIFHCFGCGKGGNALRFLMEIESVPFTEAIQMLAQKSGEELSSEWLVQSQESSISKEQEGVLEAYDWSAKLFHHVLKHTSEGKEGRNYLENRGFKQETIEKFQLGFSPERDEFLAAFLKGKGFELEHLATYGLVHSTEQSTYYDRFRGRVIFPIRNHQGKTIAFGGRATQQHQEPKYLNSPESKLFHKGRILYNFHLARKHFQKEKEVILFEGYMDVVKADQAGVHHAVATLGTSVSDLHAKTLKRYVDQVVVCFDGDEAGKHASFKAANTLKKAGLEVRIAAIPDQMDPDEYIDHYGGEYFKQKVLQPAQTYIAFALRYFKNDYNLNLDHDRIAYIEKALDIIATSDQAVERDFHLKELQDSFQLNRETLVDEIEKRVSRIKKSKQVKAKTGKNTRQATSQHQKNSQIYPAYQTAERHLIAHMLKDVSLADQVQQRLGSSLNVQEHQVLVTYLYAFYEEGNEPNVSQFVERLPEEPYKQLAIELSLMETKEFLEPNELEDYFLAIEKESDIDQEIRALESMLKRAERENDPKSAARIGMKMLELRKKSNISKLT